MVTPHTAADPWAQLAELRIKAHNSDADRVLFATALRDFHKAGWTYRQLGKANDVSHEYIRLAILDLPDDAPSSAGIEVPVRPKRLDVIPLRDLDPEVTKTLKSRLTEAVEADSSEKTPSGVKPAVADYFAALHRAHSAGWDPYSVAHALGSHPKAIFKFIAQQDRYGEGRAPDLPGAPHREEPTLWRASRPSLPLVQVPEADALELQRLEKHAFVDPVGHAAETSRYLALLGAWYLLGANRDELQRATGQNWETVRKRLVRGGFMAGQPRTPHSKAPQPNTAE
ncbi:hypothetical protein [Paenarthrobacter sp. YJN-5]|uniref:hypothetical protein n=1 Tax=unclassified Paenarthrobacter TaxID=2634190 RepID=UPI001878015C|nr:hypothetical protein [Paenarthrobacter sp. YJN-5]QOT19454.1 hypothetical protein HMI59_22695 [Paenarthrobacter sp. YJN-5]